MVTACILYNCITGLHNYYLIIEEYGVKNCIMITGLVYNQKYCTCTVYTCTVYTHVQYIHMYSIYTCNQFNY